MSFFRHCLPQGYVLKSEESKNQDLDDDDKLTMEEEIEELRAKLPYEGLTPVTLESFQAWKKAKKEKKEKKIEEERKKESKRTGTKGFHILSGRALFKYDPSYLVL